MLRRPILRSLLVPLLLASASATAGVAAPQLPDQASAEELARQLIRVSGGADIGVQILAHLVESFRQANPRVPAEFWDEFLSSVDATVIEDLVVPIYAANLTREELQAAVDFYSSPVGRSLVDKLPIIVEQSMAVGNEWGQLMAQEIVARLSDFRQAHPDV